jgi:hypothetical protein
MTHQGNWQPQFPRIVIVVVMLHPVTCSAQADDDSRKLLLHCGCQFPWSKVIGTGQIQYLLFRLAAGRRN